MNTATVEAVQVKSNQQGFISNSEKEEQGGRADSSDSKAQSFPSDKEVSPDDVPCTTRIIALQVSDQQTLILRLPKILQMLTSDQFSSRLNPLSKLLIW